MPPRRQVPERNRRHVRTFALTSSKERRMETYDPDKNPTEVRQASPRKMNLRVLIMSLIGVVALFAIIFIIFTVTQPAPV
jgi:hypothetical protein